MIEPDARLLSDQRTELRRVVVFDQDRQPGIPQDRCDGIGREGTHQPDLQFALHPAHGDFPHIVVAPGDIDESFVDSFESFNWADRYQMPVVVLLEKFLASSMFTNDGIDMSKLKIDRGLVHQPEADSNGYRRHALTADGISPRTLPGMPGGIFSTTSFIVLCPASSVLSSLPSGQ